MVVGAALTVLGVWAGRSGLVPLLIVGGLAGCVGALAFGGRGVLVAVFVAVTLVGGVRSSANWSDAAPRSLGPYVGWARIVDDPRPFGTGWRVTLEVQGERFDAWCYGSARRRVQARQAGEWVWVAGRRTPMTNGRARAALRHVVGRMSVDYLGDWRVAAPLARSANRVRAAVRQAAEAEMEADDAALFAGLVLGDDVRQPAGMIEQFRSSGLSHLTAVSGQNVALILMLVGPVVRRARAAWLIQIALVGWLAMATRFEPSVLRASVMAILALYARARGRPTSTVRLLAVATAGLALVDPMLVWRIGFWLSVTATIGVCVISPVISRRLPGPEWLAESVGITLGAQVAVAAPSLLVFGRLPYMAIFTNVLAVPVAGAVMAVGLPLSLAARAVPSLSGVLMAVPSVGTRWVRVVAALGARLEPHGHAAVVAWTLTLAVAAVSMRTRGTMTRRGRLPDHR